MSVSVGKPTPAAPRVRRRSRRPIFLGIVVIVALGFLIGKGLDNATMYFRTADEAIAQRDALDGKRFRLEGTVVAGTVKQEGPYVNFQIASKTTTIDVRNEGQPVGIFQDNIPVVVEGKFAEGSNQFDSDRILVRHSEEYTAKNPDRVNGSANNPDRAHR
jgi:cytochrome c-type biogenesis protein CcmE